MYLLMLLAAFVSAIYGYNLSPRDDYERDITYKQALSVLYKFMWQEHVVYNYALPVLQNPNLSDQELQNLKRSQGLKGITTGEKFYGWEEGDECPTSEACTESTLVMKPGLDIPGSPNSYLHSKWKKQLMQGGTGSLQDNQAQFLPPGRNLYNGEEMMVRYLVVNPKNATEKADLSDKDANITECKDGYTTGNNAHVEYKCFPYPSQTSSAYCPRCRRFLVSYKKIDARFLNRLTQGVSVDFYRILRTRYAKENIGIIKWDGHYWQFDGKIGLPDLYKEEMEAWYDNDDNYDITRDEEGHEISRSLKKSFTSDMMQKTRWTLNKKLFTDDYFEDKNKESMCENGCLFRIREVEQ